MGRTREYYGRLIIGCWRKQFEVCGPIGPGILLADASKIERDSRCTKEVRLMLWDAKTCYLGYGMLGLYSPLQRFIA